MAAPEAKVDLVSLLSQQKEGIVKDLILNDPKLVTKVQDGRQLIHWTCSFGSLPLLNLCIDKGSKVDVEDDSGWTPLIIAASAGHKSCVDLLLSLDADVNAENSTKSTALHYAASKNHVEIAKVLIDHGADLNAQDKYLATPLHRAASKGNTKIVSLLLSNPKIAVNVADSEMKTPLHLACEEGRSDEAIMLVKKGAHLDRKNKEEKTPLDLADAGLRKTLQRLETG